MKTKSIIIIILATSSFLLGLFQLAIWIGTPRPTSEYTIFEIFWFLLKISVPIITSIICGITSSALTKSYDDEF